VSETRKLAAILVADIVGYSRLTGADEDRILARLRTLRSDLIDPTIAVHHGRIVKRTGDGSIIEFRSVVDAVRCAIELQNGLIERNAGVPEDRRIQFRVGIHVGDVVEEADGDLMGDAVNIAARLEGIAKPGAICLSEQVYWQVKGRLDLKVSDLGDTQLKNIAEPIHVYSLEVGQQALAKPAPSATPADQAKAVASKRHMGSAPLAAAIAALLLLVTAGGWYMLGGRLTKPAQAEHLSIVVLPFKNLSGDANQDYLGDVLTEELTTSLSRLPDSFVVSRTTAFAYRGKAEDVKDIGKELGVRYVLEGSAQRSGQRVRVNAQLIDATTGAHLWADQLDANQSDLLEMQDEIVTRLARALQVQLAAVEASRVKLAHPENSDADELAMQCEAAYLRWGATRKETQPAYTHCERALEMDSRNVRALAILGLRSQARVIQLISDDPEAELRRANDFTARALALDPNYYLVHYARALYLAFQQPDEAIAEAERALALNPSFVPAYTALWAANWTAGRPEKAIEYAETALRLSPHDPVAYFFQRERGIGLFSLSHYAEAAGAFRASVASTPELTHSYVWLTASLALAGQEADSRKALQRYLALSTGEAESIAELKRRQPFESPFVRKVYEGVYVGLRKAGMPEE
jgi:adenylate cyclase